MGCRYIKLDSWEIEMLSNASKSSKKQDIRHKFDAILLSNRGYDVISLSKLYQVRPHTIRQ